MPRSKTFLTGCAAFSLFAFAGFSQSSETPGAAERFVRQWGDEWFKHMHPDIEEAYPFGRSNRNHDAEVTKALEGKERSKDVRITDPHYLFDGDSYAVEWLYHATDVQTGTRQVEATLAFGEVRDGQLILWKEYFDDCVGELQAAGELPLYEPGEEPYPWPAGAGVRHPYRP